MISTIMVPFTETRQVLRNFNSRGINGDGQGEGDIGCAQTGSD